MLYLLQPQYSEIWNYSPLPARLSNNSYTLTNHNESWKSSVLSGIPVVCVLLRQNYTIDSCLLYIIPTTRSPYLISDHKIWLNSSFLSRSLTDPDNRAFPFFPPSESRVEGTQRALLVIQGSSFKYLQGRPKFTYVNLSSF